MKMRTHYFRGLSPHEFYRTAYHEWGDPDKEPGIYEVRYILGQGSKVLDKASITIK